MVAALTGLAYTTTPQLDTILYGDQLTVAQVGDRRLPLAEQIGAARNAHPDGSITTVQPGDGDRTTKVVFSLPELGENQHTVYIDPYTGESRGSSPPGSGPRRPPPGWTTCTVTCTWAPWASTTPSWPRAGCG